MEQLENNAYFWQKMDTLLLSSACKIAHEKGSAHPVGTDSQPIHVYKGSLKAQNVDAIVVSADILKKDCEVKLLIGCNEDEKLKILEFLNQTQFQKAILIQRGNQIPGWANND